MYILYGEPWLLKISNCGIKKTGRKVTISLKKTSTVTSKRTYLLTKLNSLTTYKTAPRHSGLELGR